MEKEKFVSIDKTSEHEGFTYAFGIRMDEQLNLCLYTNAKKDKNFIEYVISYSDFDKAINDFNEIIAKPYFDAMDVFATRLALNKHNEQKDRGGHPYAYHVLSVRNRFENAYLRTIGVLHDIVEDTDITLDFLALYFPKTVVEAVDAITRRKENKIKESDKIYYKRIKENDLATQVKIQDLINNSDLTRLNKLVPSLNDINRQIKYANHLFELISTLQSNSFKA